MRPSDLLVVGAGVTGLTVAAVVGRRVSVTLIDRLPAVGGVLGYEGPTVRRLQREAQRVDVRFLLGATALRWRDNQLLVAGPAGIEWLAARCLAVCGGTRPSTAAELAIGGDRPAGVYSATVAIHLMEAGVRLGNHVVVVGASDWAARAAQHLARQDVMTSVVLDAEQAPLFGDHHFVGWWLLEVHGSPRVTDVALTRNGSSQRIDCDAVVLGAHLKPMRNIDGALHGGVDVTYVQPLVDVTTAREAEEYARSTGVRMLAEMGGKS